MARTGEKYTVALRVLLADPAALADARAEDKLIRVRQEYPSTPRDGLDGRHVLSAFETARRRH
jgi:hypothetical protein